MINTIHILSLRTLKLWIFCAMIVVMCFNQTVAYSAMPDVTEFVKDIGDQADLYDPSEDELHRRALDKPGIDMIQSTILQIVDVGKYALGTICIIMLGILGVKMTVTTGTEEAITEAKSHFMYALIGFLVVMSADFAVANVFYGAEAEVLQSTTTAQYFARIGSIEILRIVHGIEFFAGAIAVFTIILNGFKIATNFGGEIDEQKKSIQWALGGLVMIGLSELVIKNIFFANQGETVDIQAGISLLITVTNFISGFAALVAVSAVIYGGIQYVLAGITEGSDEKGKNAIKAAVIGIIIMAGGYALTYTLIEFGY